MVFAGWGAVDQEFGFGHQALITVEETVDLGSGLGSAVDDVKVMVFLRGRDVDADDVRQVGSGGAGGVGWEFGFQEGRFHIGAHRNNEKDKQQEYHVRHGRHALGFFRFGHLR